MPKWNANDYHKSSGAQQIWALELLAKLNLKGTEIVLDIGCGDGKITAEIARNLSNGFVLGIDSSNDMIDFAKKTFPSTKYPNLDFKVMDAGKIDLNKKFDLVFSSSTLHWVKDHKPVLAGIKKILMPGGKVLMQMGGKGNADQMFHMADEVITEARWSKYFTSMSRPWGFYGPDEYKPWLNEAGLKTIRVELVPKDMVQKGKEGLKAWIRTTWLPYAEKLPQELREEFIDELADKYIAKYPLDKDGNVHMQMARLEVEADG